jgi:hypothetical protein
MADEIPARTKMDTATGTAAPAATPHPWAPAPWVPPVAAVVAGILATVGPLMAAPGLTAGMVFAAIVTGAGTGLAAFLGIKSGGTAR